MSNWHYDKDRVLRGALFGSGQVTNYHMHAWQEIDSVEIVAVANRTIDKAYKLAEEFKIGRDHVYSSHKMILEKEHIDFVDIATAPAIHYDQVIDAINHGKHILCQKPFSTDIASAVDMTNTAKDAGLLLSINENWRWRSWYRKIKNILENEMIGNPSYLYIRRHNNATLPTLKGLEPQLAEKQPYTINLDRLILFEWGIHVVDVTRFLFGEPVSVFADTLKVSQHFKGEDRILLVLSYNDRHALLDLSWATISDDEEVSQFEKVEIEGDKGSIRLDPDMDSMLHVKTQDGEQIIPASSLKESEEYQISYTRTHKDFIESLRSGNLPESYAAENLKTFALVFAAYQSADEKRVIEVEEFNQEHLF